MPLLLEGVSVSRSFGGVRALDHLDFRLGQGEVLGVIGPNGSGKTTLIDLVSGNLAPSSGEIRFRGTRISGQPPHRIARLGIARSFQLSRAFLGMTVEENILVGALFGSRLTAGARSARTQAVDRILEFLGFTARRHQPVHRLNVADRKKVDLGRALAMNPQLLLLDELMAGLNTGDTEGLMDALRAVHRQGITLVIIEHVMNVIVSLCSRVLVLHQGRKIADGSVRDVMSDRTVLTAYLGAGFVDHRADERDRP
jgi:branched-chain amino acid transport system ATP-binding protein